MTEPTSTQKIVPCVWLNRTAAQAAAYYVSVFRDARIGATTRYPDDPDTLLDFQREFAGRELTVDLHIGDFTLQLLNAGDEFTPNPALNFMLHFDPTTTPDAREYLDEVYAALLEGGSELMPLQSYDFSPHYAWVQDRYGVNWQLMLTDPSANVGGREITDAPLPFVMPSFMFGGSHQNECAAAVDDYLAIFGDSALRTRVTYDQIGRLPDAEPDEAGPITAASVAYSDFTLAGLAFTAMDSGAPQLFTFTEGVSLIVNCADQEEIDRLWAALSAVPEAEACGWCRDAHGVSWQIVPENWDELSAQPDAFGTLLRQRKIVIADY